MTIVEQTTGIYFIYDGDCPLCTRAALALRIKKAYGALHLIDARENPGHPLVRKVTALQLDLDEGMVLYDGDRFHHGKDALKLMARYSEHKGFFNLFTKSLYWSDFLACLTYPPMRATRNWLLSRTNVSPLDNLSLKAEPVFKPIFGNSWNEMPAVMHRHYANHPYSQDRSRVEGQLDVMSAGPVKWLAPLLWMMKGIPPANEHAVKVTVEFTSEPNSRAFHFNRCFHFSDRSPYRFRSRMFQVEGNEVIEVMASRLGWRTRVVWQDQRVKLQHRGYALYLFGCFIPLPVTWLLGVGYAEETAIDDNSFDMSMEIIHPLWGQIYGYQGRFHIVADA